MEFFGLHIPPFVVTATTVAYSIVVAICLLSCFMKGWLWGKWKWCFLIWLISLSLGPILLDVYLDPFTPAPWYSLIVSPLVAFCFDKWRKWGLSKVEYLLISIFTMPFLLCLYLLLIVVAMGMEH